MEEREGTGDRNVARHDDQGRDQPDTDAFPLHRRRAAEEHPCVKGKELHQHEKAQLGGERRSPRGGSEPTPEKQASRRHIQRGACDSIQWRQAGPGLLRDRDNGASQLLCLCKGGPVLGNGDSASGALPGGGCVSF